MGNLVAKNVEANFEQLCQQLVANDPRAPNGQLKWASPPFTEAEQTRLHDCLGKNTTLKRIVLHDLDTLPDCAALAQILSSHSALTSLCFFGRLPKENFSVFAKAFLASTTMTKLELNTCIIPPETVDGIVSILSTSKAITSLRLRGCQIQAVDLDRLTLALQETSTLLALEITLKPPITTATSAQYLADFFQAQKAPLQDVSFAGFLADAIPTIAKGATGHTTLQRLKLQEPAVNDNSVQAIGELLPSLPALLKLDLSNCNITGVGGKLLGEALEKGSNSLTLRELYLSHNALADDGTVAISSALKHCSNLLVLDMRLNKIGTAGIVALSKALENNPALLALRIGEEFVMPGRKFEQEDMQALADMLLSNKTLVKLYMEDASFHDEGMDLILEAMSKNKTLQDWSLSCFSNASLKSLISKLPEVHLKKLSIRAQNDLEVDEVLGQEILINLRKNESLLEFGIEGLKDNSEAAWKSVEPGVKNLLMARKRESGTKRPLDADDSVTATTEDNAKAIKKPLAEEEDGN